MTVPDWWLDWSDRPCVIVASGPSAADVPIEAVRGRCHVLAINSSWSLCPWADALFACDHSWWAHARGCPEFAGLKLTTDPRAAKTFGVNFVKCRKPDDRFIVDQIGIVGWGGNSGFQALNLAVQWGARNVILVGYDMTVRYGMHWHGDHPSTMSNPKVKNVERWRRSLDAAAKVAKAHGVHIVNCSPVSELKNYPKMSLEKALERLERTFCGSAA